MKQIDTERSTIFRFDNALPDSICDMIVKYLIDVKGMNAPVNYNVPPWQNNDFLNWRDIKDDNLLSLVTIYREIVTDVASRCYAETVYPHFTELVIWRTGRSMDRHIDNGYTDEDVYMRQRSYTTITYLNDDYTGGETYIASENGDYISVPKKGSLVLMKSTSDNAHGVRPITSGTRFTLPIWFTRNFDNREL